MRVNRAFCEMTRRTAEALIGQDAAFIPSGPPNIWNELYRFCFCRLAGDMPPHGFELPASQRADGESFWVRLYATLLDQSPESANWLAGVDAPNITELEKKREAIAKAPAFSHRAQRSGCGGVHPTFEDRQLFSNRAL